MVIAAASVAVLAVAGGFAVLDGSDRTLRLEVTSPAEQAAYVNWSGPDDDYEAHEVSGRPVQLPWHMDLDVSAVEGVIRLNAGSARGSRVTCRILRDGVVLAEQKDIGQIGCMVSVNRAFAAAN